MIVVLFLIAENNLEIMRVSVVKNCRRSSSIRKGFIQEPAFSACLNEDPALGISGGWLSSEFFWMAFFPICMVIAAVALEYSGFDLWWEANFFDALTKSWPYREHWLFDQVIHNGGRILDKAAAGVWLLMFAGTAVYQPFRRYRKLMLYFLGAAAAGPVIVGILKQLTHIYTPWDIKPFSGPYPYIRLFDPVPGNLPAGGAFPSGHASGGYAFFSLYFLLCHLGSDHSRFGLAIGLILGGIYGIGQQVRGAHFPSHDLFAMVICWYSAFFVYALFYPEQWRYYSNV